MLASGIRAACYTIEVKHHQTWVCLRFGCSSCRCCHRVLKKKMFKKKIRVKMPLQGLWLLLASPAVLVAAVPIEKRINWFVSPHISPKQSEFLLSSSICDGVYTCCGGASFLPNGTGGRVWFCTEICCERVRLSCPSKECVCAHLHENDVFIYHCAHSAPPGFEHNRTAAISRG